MLVDRTFMLKHSSDWKHPCFNEKVKRGGKKTITYFIFSLAKYFCTEIYEVQFCFVSMHFSVFVITYFNHGVAFNTLHLFSKYSLTQKKQYERKTIISNSTIIKQVMTVKNLSMLHVHQMTKHTIQTYLD